MDLYSDIQNSMYEFKPGFTMRMTPGFTMTDMDLSVYNKQVVLLSLPMYATLANTKISQLPFERLIIKMKDLRNKDQVKLLKKALAEHIDDSGYHGNNYMIRDYFEDQAVLPQIEVILRTIFSIVIPITMFLCYFSLTASMSANLHDQSKEIVILRAIGF